MGTSNFPNVKDASKLYAYMEEDSDEIMRAMEDELSSFLTGNSYYRHNGVNIGCKSFEYFCRSTREWDIVRVYAIAIP